MLRRVFLFRASRVGSDHRRKPERETRIPGSRMRAGRSAGPAGGNGASASRSTNGRANRSRVRFGGAPYSRAPRRNLFCNQVQVAKTADASSVKRWPQGHSAFECSPANALVVKVSDTSHRKRWPSRLQSIVPWNPSGGMGVSRVSARSQDQTCVSIVVKPESPVPQRAFDCGCVVTHIGMAAVKMSVPSVERRASGGRGFKFRQPKGCSSVAFTGSPALPVPRQPFVQQRGENIN